MTHIFNTEITTESRFYYNRLFHDYIFNFPALNDFFPYDYRQLTAYRQRIENIRKNYDNRVRQDVADILEDTNSTLGAGKKTMENIKNLSKKDSVIVIGGQQPGLFTGSSFIIYKVITVLKLSRYIQGKTGVRVIPCFWNASDDSSLEQADSLGILTNGYRRLNIDTSGVANGTRLSNVYLPVSHYREVIKEMSSLLPEAGLENEVGNFLGNAVSESEDMEGRKGYAGLAGLFSTIILRLFSLWGPVIIDPSHHRLKKAGAGLLKWDIENYKVINELITDKGRKLEKAGYHAQITPNRDVLDFFINKDNIREKINILPGGSFETGGKEYTGEGLLAATDKHPSSVSWNVVLRPIVQDTVFPVAAAVCGPGEVSYFAQLGEVYSHRGVSMPVIYPRFSATIIEDRIAGLIKRAGITEKHLSLKKEDIVKAVLKSDETESMENLIKELDDSIAKNLRDTENRIRDNKIDPGSAFDRIRRNVANEVKVLSKKLFSALKKQNQSALNSIDRIYMNLFPQTDMQERAVNIFYYLNKYGIKIIEDLYRVFRPLKYGHMFIYIKEDKKDEKRK